mmetsp:Transcript_82874/g.222276  ORF Transcript_82874/g.222276 Transcript_82874/m.222276 type:complete len:186 (-) Transcript_82874:1602-2159(-)
MEWISVQKVDFHTYPCFSPFIYWGFCFFLLSDTAIQDRSQRFSSGDGKTVVSLKGTGGPASHVRTQLGLDGARAGDMVGTSEALERPYLRLHFAPDPSTIRPARVLREALNLVKRKWVKGPDYAHASEQLMSIQQDCKLQGLEGDLAFDAYETHARIAIERSQPSHCSYIVGVLLDFGNNIFAGQ